jgi:pyruvate kinase
VNKHFRRVRIVATVGPASRDEATVTAMIAAGMDVARLNLSHGTHEDHARAIAIIRRAATRAARPIAIMADLQGVKIRTGAIHSGRAELEAGAPFVLTTRQVPGNKDCVSVDWPTLPSDVRPGNQLLLDDGRLRLEVLQVKGEDIHTRVLEGGVLTPHKGVNLPGVRLSAPSLTEKDRVDIAFALENGVDAIALSFVRSAENVAHARQAILAIDPSQTRFPIIAKLERAEAVDNLDAIAEVADGVMVARGDLGVEMSAAVVPTAQKCIIQGANVRGKLVITATQMLETMINNPTPTRAEASDVANAVYDGTDAVMLSGETAVGKYPVEAVRTMALILEEAEQHLDQWGRWKGPEIVDTQDDALAIAHAARELAGDRDVAAIAVFTRTGRAARLMSKERPAVPILAFTPAPATYPRMAMMWGVIPYLVPEANTLEEMLAHVESAMIAASPIQPGQQVVLIAGLPLSVPGPPNFVLLHTVGRR